MFRNILRVVGHARESGIEGAAVMPPHHGIADTLLNWGGQIAVDLVPQDRLSGGSEGREGVEHVRFMGLPTYQ